MENNLSEFSEAGVTAAVDDGEGSGTQSLAEERQKMSEEFNVQRAKMKELFLQKEEEMRQMLLEKQQFQSEVLGLRAELQQQQTLSENQKSEIESLQLLIHETVESSSSVSTEVRRLQTRNLELEQQLNLITKQQAAQDAALAPAALVRTLARKLGADSDEEHKKVSRHDESELLRSLVEPLEGEIKALKEKLRDTDTQLQQQLALQKKSGKPSASVEASEDCDMCMNYEKQLVSEQARCSEAAVRAADLERRLKLATEELEGARSVHDDTVREWRSDRAASVEQVKELRKVVDRCKEEVERRSSEADEATRAALQRVTALTVQRETLQEALHTLQRDNEMLIGKYTKKALELQNEDINLPDNVEELQELALRLREELIVSALGKEEAQDEEKGMREQLVEQARLWREQAAAQRELEQKYTGVRQQLEQLEADRQQLNELGDKLTIANNRVEELLQDKKRRQDEAAELRARVSALQADLDNSEKVQQDFVRLSQSLQIQLERIREADTEVRWQHEEDVNECSACRTHLASNKHKLHCRHCGRIFCSSCVSSRVSSGPRGAAARVCAVCYTLLQPHAAPYFSTQAPQQHA